MGASEEEFADLLAQVAGLPYEVEALPRTSGLRARGLNMADRLDDDLGLDGERRRELVVALGELCGAPLADEEVRAVMEAATVGDLWRAAERISDA